MDITLSLNEVEFMATQISKLKTTKLPSTVAFQFFSLAKKLSDVNKSIAETKQGLVEKYDGKLGEDKQHYIFDGENAENVNKEMQELYEQEYEIKDVTKIDFKKLDKLEMSVEDIAALEPVLDNLPS